MNLLLFVGSDGSMSSGSIMLAIFDVVIMVVGIYSIYTAVQMKKTGTPPEWLVTKKDLKKMKKPEGFCEKMGPKTIIFGIVCIVYCAYGLVAVFIIGNYWARVGGVVIFLVFVVWYFMGLQKIRDEHTK